jgi:adenine-specific DNA methylase
MNYNIAILPKLKGTKDLVGAPLPGETSVWRPIHYLGSKLRLVETIKQIVDSIDPKRGRVCDLFSGSGTVSLALSQERAVTAVDIQEYSRTICSALISPHKFNKAEINKLIKKAQSSEYFARLSWAAAPLIKHEKECLNKARGGSPLGICNIIEAGSIFSYGKEKRRIETKLVAALTETNKRLEKIQIKEGINPVILKYYGGLYFSYEQAVHLDSLVHLAHHASKEKRDTLLSAIMGTASDVVNTVGKQFAQPIKPRNKDGVLKKHLISQILRDRELDSFDIFNDWLEKYSSLTPSTSTHQAMRADYYEFLQGYRGKLGVVYADPPYTRDHYSRFYHVLETICLNDAPEISMMRSNGKELISRGIYRSERHQSPFCIKSQAPEAFRKLFAGVRKHGSPLVLSYSPYSVDAKGRPRVMTVEAIQKLAKEHFKSVQIISAGKISHNKLNHAALNSKISYDAELFLICLP